MKRWLLLVLCVFLFGCRSADAEMERALALRSKFLESAGCSFDATVTADYGDYRHTFVLNCQTDQSGSIRFEVLAPDTISGITGIMDENQGKLTFDEEVLVFSPMADGQLAPVTAPWILLQTLRSGHITACGQTERGLLLSINDSYADDALGLEVQLDGADTPVFAEIIWQGRRILLIQLENFKWL